MIEFSIYSEKNASIWNDFVSNSKNGTFLINRDYMDYHKDRFNDHSLMVFYNKKLVALLPAHLSAEGLLSSHPGLTYGGLITSVTMTASLAIEVFKSLISYLRSNGIIGIKLFNSILLKTIFFEKKSKQNNKITTSNFILSC